MDPKFDEACAQAVGFAEYRYCLMTLNGKFQWRWMNPPPEAFGYEISPVFNTQLEAIEWQRKRTPDDKLEFVKQDWKPVAC